MEQVSKQKLNWVSVVDESESEQNCNEDVKDSKLEVDIVKDVKLDTCECITKNNKKCPNLKKKGDTMFCALHRHYYDTKCRSEKLNSEPKVKVLENPSREVLSTVPKVKTQDNLETLIEIKVKQKVDGLDENAKMLLKFLLC
jgi:effector-binding domain-containing protein